MSVVALAVMSTAPVLAQQRVSIYTAHTANIVERLIPEFEKATGIKADVDQACPGIKRVRNKLHQHRFIDAKGIHIPDVVQKMSVINATVVLHCFVEGSILLAQSGTERTFLHHPNPGRGRPFQTLLFKEKAFSPQ